MHQDIIQELAIGLKLDNALCSSECASGQIPRAREEILSLAAAIQAFYVSIALESRSLGRIDACYALWTDAAQLFKELCDAWIPATDALKANPDLLWLKARLEHFRALALDRTEIYAVSEGERREFAKTKDLGFQEHQHQK